MGRPSFPTASGIHRALVCPASTVLPRSDTLSEDATRGRAVHKFLEECRNLGREAALEAVAEDYRLACEAIDLTTLPVDPNAYAAEVAFAFDPFTGKARELGRGLDRAYDVHEHEFAGTADVVGLLPGAVHVTDWKHGFGHIQHTPPARENRQLRLLALAACRAYGRESARVEIIRLTDDGGIWRDVAEFDALDLDAFALDLRALATQIMTDREAYEATGDLPPAVMSSSCRYCPAFRWCPAQTSLVRAIGTTPEQWASEASALLTPETAARAYQRLKAAEKALEVVREAIETYARQTPLDLGDGITLAPTERAREVVDGRVARQALALELGEDFAARACEWSATKSSIEAAARDYAKAHGGTLKAAKEKALEAVKRAGGLKTTISFPVVEHKASKKEAA